MYNMVDWTEATRVALSGIVSVFLVLVLLQFSVQGAGAIINVVDRKQKAREKKNLEKN